jgi:putative transcriptional regulator
MEPAAGGGRAAGGQGGGSGAAGPAAFSDERWAHALPGPEAGAVLLAHPSMFSSSQTYFRLAAILMLEVGDGGALGVILNRPTEHTLGQVQFAGDDGALVAPFRDNKLWLGGDVGESSIIVVTSSPAVAEATEVAAGLRVCSISAAAAAVEAGRAVPDDFRFFARYSGWGPGQLQRECKAGVWFVAAASAGLVLDAEPAAAGPELWHQVLNTMGGPYQELSQLIKEGEGESKRATTQQQQQQQQDQPSSGDDVA